MQIIDLADKHKELYFQCLEDWSEEMKEAGDHKACWYEKMKDKGLRVKLALDEKGEVGGMIQYIPVEYAPIEGTHLYFVNCIWVHGHKKGRGNFQKKGMGKALIRAAEEDIKARGVGGLAAWGITLPFWMKASWFKKQGYQKVDRQGMQVLLWKPFTQNAVPPKWIRQKKKPEKQKDKVVVTAFLNGGCPVQSIHFERAKRAAEKFGDCVVFRSVDTFDRDTFLEWGISDDLYINDKKITTGPPLSYKKIKKRINKEVKKLS